MREIPKAARGIEVEATRPSFPWINNYAILANCLLFSHVSPTSSAEFLDVERFAYQCRSWLPLFIKLRSRSFSGGASVAIKHAVDKHFRRVRENDPPTIIDFQQPFSVFSCRSRSHTKNINTRRVSWFPILYTFLSPCSSVIREVDFTRIVYS